MEAVTERPSLHDQQVARESLALVGKVLNQKRSKEVNIQLQPGVANQSVASVVIPTKALCHAGGYPLQHGTGQGCVFDPI